MPIGFARVEFVKRSQGKNTCQLAAYLSRARIHFEGNCALSPKTYDFSHRGSPPHDEIILPEGVNDNFRIKEVLWNAAERKEIRKDAQVSMHLVLALPDDKEINIEDRIELARSYVKKHYVDKGLGAQLVIHPPERKVHFTEDNQVLGIEKGSVGTVVREKSGSYFVFLTKGNKSNRIVEVGPGCKGISIHEHNWHAHVQLTTRRFKSSGVEFEDRKATDLMPVIRKGRVISGTDNGSLWTDHQNEFFRSKGWALRVDTNGLVPQEHLGPVRMRARAFSLLEEHENRLELNALAAEDPRKILVAISKKQSVFTKEDVERFMLKHVSGEKIPEVRDGFWKQKGLIQLRDKETGNFISRYSTKVVVEEEQQILRISTRIYERGGKNISKGLDKPLVSGLSEEQSQAFLNVLKGGGLSCIQGYAGTGKSYLLKALKDVYEKEGLTVRAFGPDNASSEVLKEKGFSSSENVYRFLFAAKHGMRQLSRGQEVWILDEAGKLGNKPLLELLKFAENKKVKLIFSGDSAQLPPVERGGAFKFFCEQFGSEVLGEVRRQKSEQDRAIAKDLAVGEIGGALDKLARSGAIRWSLTRKEAMEDLALKWANDHCAGGKKSELYSPGSSLIVAQTNAEVRVLNEMVRLVRKQRNELSAEEFECETAFGKIFIGVGDRVEFRKNDQDLGVTNGMSGVLLDAKKNRFIVAVQENSKKTRMISFNPQEYHRFQLGYASTCSRAQGRTVERAYVLHSPYLNKQMAYVGLTRHVEAVTYFVPREEALNLSDLKKAALRDGEKITTLEFTTSDEVAHQLIERERADEISRLIQSDKTLDRLRGKALFTWRSLKDTTLNAVKSSKDRQMSREFFNPDANLEDGRKAEVRKVVDEELRVEPVEASDKITPADVVSKITEKDDLGPIDSMKAEEETHDQNGESLNQLECCEKISSEKRALLNSYYEAFSKVAELRAIVDAEQAGNGDLSVKSNRSQEWKKSCLLRNRAAYNVRESLSEGEMRSSVSEKTAYFIQTQAKRHDLVLSREEQSLKVSQVKNVEDELRRHIEPLLFKLFPDGPSSRNAKSFRFGSNGSLSVVHSGEKAGSFYDFGEGKGGGLLKLIQKELHLNHEEAGKWASEFLGIASDVPIPKTFTKPLGRGVKGDSEWISLKPKIDDPAPKLEAIGRLQSHYVESGRHEYRDQNGDLLYYVLRLQDKEDLKRKITPPLSYGYFGTDSQKASWRLKGYRGEGGKNALYNAHLLKQNPSAIALVVEGEKTADQALEKLPNQNLVCITWPGGASSASKADWSMLTGRKVIIWPDNDEAGFKAAADICSELKRVGVKNVDLIDPEVLKKHLPQKWDLADYLPESMSVEDVREIFFLRSKQSVDLDDLKRHGLSRNLRTIDLLARLDDQIRPDLEKVHGNDHSKIDLQIFEATKEKVSRLENLEQQFSSGGEEGKSLAYQVLLFEIKYDREPTCSEIESLKTTISLLSREFKGLSPDATKEVLSATKDSMFERGVQSILTGRGISKEEHGFLREEFVKKTDQLSDQIKLYAEKRHTDKSTELSLER